MSANPQRAAWTSTYRVSTESRQQRILRAIHRLDHVGITALGTTRGADFIVVIECASAAAEVRSRQIVMTLDLMATRLGTTRATQHVHQGEPPSAAYLSGFAIPRHLLRLIPSERLRRLL